MAEIDGVEMQDSCIWNFSPDSEASEEHSGWRIRASGSQGGHVPENTVDGDTDTYWRSAGADPHIHYRLPEDGEIDTVGITWHNGESVKHGFRIEVSSDGIQWESVFEGVKSGSGQVERCRFRKRHVSDVRIYFLGIPDSAAAEITEVTIGS
jgi:hypothetical protein